MEESKGQENQPQNIEILVLSRLDHPNIIKLLDYDVNGRYTNRRSESRDVTMLIFEYAARGSLFELIALGGPLPEDTARAYFHDL